jgi:hypothetical protein
MHEPVREQVPEKTTPTWEMELLVSGATIFGLLQLPELMDHGYFRAMNFMPQDYAVLITGLWLYSKLGIITVALTFLAHLCLRAYWVAIVGLNSVYPGGIRWDKFRLGPLDRERLGAQAPQAQISDVIERADNRATNVFGAGVAIAMLMLAPVMLVLLALLVALVVQGFIGEGWTLTCFWVVGLAWVLPRMLLPKIDRRFGAAIQSSPRLKRAFTAVNDAYGRVGLGPRNNPLLALFASHVGRGRFILIVALVFLPVAIGIVFSNAGRMPFGLFGGFPGSNRYSDASSPAAFYFDQRRNPREMLPAPHIPSRVVSGNYLEVFVPFVPRLHGPAMRAKCAGQQGAATRDRARLDCLARIIAMRVDGAPVAVPLDASTDPDSDEQGVVAMIPVTALAPGRHELSLNEPEHLGLDGGAARRYRIAFWK